MAKVFISYSHDSDLHSQRVQSLAAQLRAHTVEVTLDRDLIGGPDKGWNPWSRAQIRDEETKILIVCTERYCARFEGREKEGVGLGAIVEARLIQQYIDEAGGENHRFRAVILDPTDEKHVPDTLRTYHRFRVYQDDGLEELISWLIVSPQTTSVTTPQITWPPPPKFFVWDMADRTDITIRLTQILSGQSSKRILLLRAASNSGKTHLLSQLGNYAKTLAMPRARFDCKGATSLQELVNLVALDLQNAFLSRPSDATDLISRLQRLTQPLLLTFDTYEQASGGVKTWIESQLLERIDDCPAIAVVIAGQQIPDRAKQLWSNLADEHELGPIADPHDWLAYVHRKGHSHLNIDHVTALTLAVAGNPGNLSALIDKVTGGLKVAGA